MAFCKWKKNKIWIWRAVCGVSRRAIAWHVGNRSDASLMKLIRQIDDGTCVFITDEPDSKENPEEKQRLLTEA